MECFTDHLCDDAALPASRKTNLRNLLTEIVDLCGLISLTGSINRLCRAKTGRKDVHFRTTSLSHYLPMFSFQISTPSLQMNDEAGHQLCDWLPLLVAPPLPPTIMLDVIK